MAISERKKVHRCGSSGPLFPLNALLRTWSNGAIVCANQRSATNDIPKADSTHNAMRQVGLNCRNNKLICFWIGSNSEK